ncbi:hypothetical protein [Methanobacterium aggregans]|uniref:hypothetical protein n=1 Tax=Methanobacterium aggregans TaxID=1615586 RepID=UPI001AE38276|nr:hypothetical protein [Methanobacterium aggregans]MBP2046075.1 cobalamin biosynthesis Mg chelatase CobN [Methanobacterium aggregans]
MKFKSSILSLLIVFSVLMIPSCVSAHEIPFVTSESISGSLNSEITLQYISPMVKGSSGSHRSSSSKSYKSHMDDNEDTGSTDDSEGSTYFWIFVIIAIIVLVFAIWFFFLRKR